MFKVGDKVYCKLYKNKGIVKGTTACIFDNYNIEVYFNINNRCFTDCYTESGFINSYSKTLYLLKMINTRYNRLKGCYV